MLGFLVCTYFGVQEMGLGFEFEKYCSDMGTWLDSWQECILEIVGIVHFFVSMSTAEIMDYAEAFYVFGGSLGGW